MSAAKLYSSAPLEPNTNVEERSEKKPDINSFKTSVLFSNKWYTTSNTKTKNQRKV